MSTSYTFFLSLYTLERTVGECDISFWQLDDRGAKASLFITASWPERQLKSARNPSLQARVPS